MVELVGGGRSRGVIAHLALDDAVEALAEATVERYIAARERVGGWGPGGARGRPERPRRILLDIDATDDPAHGNQ
jgi:hypothetical protein